MKLRTILAAVALVALAAVAAVVSRPAHAGGAKLLFRSAISLDAKNETVTLPLFKGRTANGKATYYIVTESSTRTDAKRRGVTFAPKLANARGTKAVQVARIAGKTVVFPGTVDFSPEHVVVPSTDGFPPSKAVPGAVGDARYSPLVSVLGSVLDAPQVANASGKSDSVVSIDTKRGRVTLKLLRGFFNGTSVLYLRTDASVEVVAALEASTYAPNLSAAPGLGSNASSSARSAIIPIVNGARGKDNAQRQGLQSAVLGEGDPLNITQSFPGEADYSPIWDLHPAVWKDGATPKRLSSAEAVAAAFKAGSLTSGGTGPANPSLGGLKAAAFISNCSTVALG